MVKCFWEIFKKPKFSAVYNIGGGRYSNCSIIEAIQLIEKITNFKIKLKYIKKSRLGDHKWYITDLTKFSNDYPNWKITYNTASILKEILFNYGYKEK